jgi:NitT/TauT family transport system substrate-binding protein
VAVVNTATPGLVGYALADPAAGIQLWEPAYTTLLAKKPGLRTIDLEIGESWRKFAPSRDIPYLGVAAHIDWVRQHPDVPPRLYATYRAAAQWTLAHPEEAAQLIVPEGSAEDRKAMADLVRANARLGLNVRWASDLRDQIKAVYAVERSIGFLPSDARETIYSRPD